LIFNEQNGVALIGNPVNFHTLSVNDMVMPLIKRTNTILYCNYWKETGTFYRDRLGLEIAFQNDWLVEFSLTRTALLSICFRVLLRSFSQCLIKGILLLLFANLPAGFL
jgi:hypothetical protein